VEHDPETKEPILFELRHRALPAEQARLSQMSAADLLLRKPAATRWVFDVMSWSSVALTILLLVVPAFFTHRLLERIESPGGTTIAFVLWLGLFMAVGLANQAHYRNYVTPTLFVRRYGLLGRGRKTIRLAAIERVEADRSRYGSYGESSNLGDLRIEDRGGSVRIFHVFEADRAAEAITDIKNGQPPAEEKRA
jgi:hypothetical protein